MKSFVVLSLAIISCATVCHGYLRLIRGRSQKVQRFHDDAGEPLILTPLIQANKIQEAQAAAQVTLDGAKNIESYSGFLTVNEQYNSNLYFWFFKSQNDASTDPVVLWLQGGPGSSSLFGLFVENGPFFVNETSQLEPREHAWTKNHSVLYIDNPVGTGFSFTKGGYADNQTQVGKELYDGLIQFFQLFPDLQKNDFFITGESYAGKYIPAIGHTILKKNPHADLKISLKGVAIGDGLSDPITQFTQYGPFLYDIGLIDNHVRDQYTDMSKQLVDKITQEDWHGAMDVVGEMMMDFNSLFSRTTGFQNVYNFLYPIDPTETLESSYIGFINQATVRRALHVGNLDYGDNGAGEHLTYDIPKSVKPWVVELLSNCRVLIYSGQVDIIVANALTQNYIQNMEFSAAEEYRKAQRRQYKVGNELAGYSKVAGNLTELLIRNAGHMVPYDQPLWSLDMLTRFTRNQPFN